MIEHDEFMGRDYIALPGGWEFQTRGNGSTVRLANTVTGERYPLALPEPVLAALEQMARAAVAAEREACADAESDAGRLALELERLLVSNDMPAASRWRDSANEALDLHRSRLDAIRARGAKGCEKC